MSLFEALILGLVQGFTEFLPVSSSAHLAITKWLLGIESGPRLQYFDLLCHGGTLLAVILFLRKEILEVLKSVRLMSIYSLALIPLVFAYFFLKPLRMAFSQPQYLGGCLMLTSGLLFLASRRKIAVVNEVTDLKWKDVVCIGGMQALALIPGISRSGSTISAARFCGWSWTQAAKFSFLLAVPTILGGEILETLKMVRETSETLPSACYAVGFGASFGVGLLSIRWMFRIYEKGLVLPFAWYCLGMGLLVLGLFHG